jgi:hypothetical protein
MQEITDQMAIDILVGVESKEDLRLQRLIVVEPQGDRADGRDFSPVTSDWRNLWIGAFSGPSLGCDGSISIRRFIDTQDGFAVAQLFLSCSASSLSQRCFSSGSFSAAVSRGLTGR